MCPIAFAPDFSTFLCVQEGKKSKNNKKKFFLKKICPWWDLNPDLPIRSQVYLPYSYRVFAFTSLKILCSGYSQKSLEKLKNFKKFADHIF